MKVFLFILKILLLTTILTILTQVGGLIYILYQPISFNVKKHISHPLKSFFLRLVIFSGMMVVFSLLIIPPLARSFGRVPLPLAATKQHPVQPANFLYVLANRHYVRPALKQVLIETAGEMSAQYPGTRLTFLDANFPFLNNFPLLPHLSHDDGKKVDLCFLYQNRKTGRRIRGAATFWGYGHTEQPRPGEPDQPAVCAKRGEWQYNFISKITPQRQRYEFDQEANRVLLQHLSKNKAVGKIFIEPHLKSRLGLQAYGKIRYHGCHAVRHDDHIHIQL